MHSTRPDAGAREPVAPTAGASWWAHARVMAFHALCTGVVLHAAVLHFATRPMVGTGDSSIFTWSWWHLGRSLAEGRNPLRTTALFHPVGVDLSVTVAAPLIGLVTWPIRALLGPEAQINAVQLSAAWLAAVATYFLLVRLGSRRWIAAIGGAAYSFTPYRVVHAAEHLNLINTAVLPACLLLALRVVERPTARRFAALGAGLGAAVLVEPQLAVISGVGVLVLVVRRWEGPVPTARALACCVGVALVVAAPVALPMAWGLLGGASSRPPSATAITTVSSRLTSWVVPSPRHLWLGGLSRHGLLAQPSEGVASPSLVVLGLALLGRRRTSPRERRGWVALTWAGVVLSLGPFLTVGAEYAPIPLPYAALRLLPLMDTMRVPGRFALLGVLGLVVLATQTANALVDRRPRGRAVVAGILVAALAFELLPATYVSRQGGAPSPYEAIARVGGEAAVLELPLQWSTGVELVGYPQRDVSIFEAWATVHGHPYVGGSVSRYPDRALRQLESIPLYQQVRALQGDAVPAQPATFDAQDLRSAGIGFVVYHRDIPLPALLAHLRGLHLPVLADDGTVVVWRVPPA